MYKYFFEQGIRQPKYLRYGPKKSIRVGKVISVDTYTEINAPKVFRKANTKAIDQNAPI